MNDDCSTWARAQRVGNSTGKLLLICLAHRCDALGAVYVSQKNMSDETELSDDTLRDRLTTLEDLGLIDRFKMRRDDGGFTVDLIVLLHSEQARRFSAWVRHRATPVARGGGKAWLTIPFTDAKMGVAFMAETGRVAIR